MARMTRWLAFYIHSTVHSITVPSCNGILTVNLGGSVLKARSHLLLQSQQFDCLKMDPTKRYFEHPWFLQPPLLK